MLWLKLKAGALQLTLLIAVVVALLLTTFILLVHTHKQFKTDSHFIIETVKNANKGIDYGLLQTLPLNDTIPVTLGDQDYKSLLIHRSFWGLFEKLTSVSKIKNKTFKKTALIGAKQTEDQRIALYVQDNNKPLVLAGNTKIEGNAYLPKQGLKFGTISGQSYYGSKLIYGSTKIASTLPKLFSETEQQIKTIAATVLETNQKHILNLQPNQVYQNSFFKPTQLVFSNGQINLSGMSLTGNIIVLSKSRIIVDAASNIKDAVLIAPHISIKDGVRSSFQAIASKTLTVGKNVILRYPSALVLNERQSTSQQNIRSVQNEENGIQIDKNSSIEGLVIYLGKKTINNYKVQVKLEAGTSITGELYCNENIELRGHVYGTVYANNFIVNQFGSVYQNHIFNGQVTVKKRPLEYVGLAFNNSKKDIVKWLY